MFREMRACCGFLAISLLLCGIAYPLACLGVGQALFYDKAQGSLVGEKGRFLGSSLIGQRFAQAGNFRGRPSVAGDSGYDAMRSGASNLGPSSVRLRKIVGERIAAWRASGLQSPMPSDLATASASGLDPDISPASAYFQAGKIASERGINVQRIHALIERLVIPRELGFLGEPRVNVLALNRALGGLAPDDVSSLSVFPHGETLSPESGLVIPLPGASSGAVPSSETDSPPVSGAP